MLLAASLTPIFGQSGAIVLARQAPGGSITFQSYEIVTINGRDSVRVLSEPAASLEERVYGRLSRVKIGQAGPFRRDGNQMVSLSGGEDGKRALVLPDQLKLKAAQNTDELWNGISITGKLTRKDTDEASFTAQELFAVLPGSGAEPAVAFALQPANFKGLDERLNAIRGVAASFAKAPEVDRLRAQLEQELRAGLQSFDNGGPYSAIFDNLKIAGAAASIFPDAQPVAELGRTLQDRKALVDKTALRLESLYNAERWDDFLEAYAPFERYQASFPKLARLHKRAFRESARRHATRGRELAAQKNYADTLKELRAALRRDPLNRPLQDLTEEKRLEASLALARHTAASRKGLAKDSPQEVRFSRHLSYAARFIADKKFAEAEQEITGATELDRDSPKILLVKAKLANARSELIQALGLLNKYDESVIEPDERRQGEEVRVEVLYALNKRKADDKASLAALYQSGRYSEVFTLAQKALELDTQDPDFLYYAGASAAILRKNPPAADRLRAFLEASNSAAGDQAQRNRAFRVLSILQTAPPQTGAASGTPNWFSGRKLAPEVAYCPESLAFQPKIAAIRSGKQEQTFEWAEEDHLKTIGSRFDDDRSLRDYLAKAAASGRTIPTAAQATPGSYTFEYFPGSRQVARIAEEKVEGAGKLPEGVVLTRTATGDIEAGFAAPGSKPDPRFRGVILPDNPSFNPEVVAALEGPANIGFAPNPYFNPFLWTGMHLFRFTHDTSGRVISAIEIGAPRKAIFTWEGERLHNVAVYSTEGGRERPIYRRSMTYSGDKLISESVEYGGKQAKIVYKFVGNKLTEAVVDDPAAFDGGERRVRFL